VAISETAVCRALLSANTFLIFSVQLNQIAAHLKKSNPLSSACSWWLSANRSWDIGATRPGPTPCTHTLHSSPCTRANCHRRPLAAGVPLAAGAPPPRRARALPPCARARLRRRARRHCPRAARRHALLPLDLLPVAAGGIMIVRPWFPHSLHLLRLLDRLAPWLGSASTAAMLDLGHRSS
jgi:hypothetical protein